jgi:hypothetical protein
MDASNWINFPSLDELNAATALLNLFVTVFMAAIAYRALSVWRKEKEFSMFFDARNDSIRSILDIERSIFSSFGSRYISVVGNDQIFEKRDQFDDFEWGVIRLARNSSECGDTAYSAWCRLREFDVYLSPDSSIAFRDLTTDLLSVIDEMRGRASSLLYIYMEGKSIENEAEVKSIADFIKDKDHKSRNSAAICTKKIFVFLGNLDLENTIYY